MNSTTKALAMHGSTHRPSVRWRLSRAEISQLTLGQHWNPLDEMPAPDCVPPAAWDGPHVGIRLTDAFVTLGQLPLRERGRSRSGYWPEYFYEWEDLLAQRTADSATQEDDAQERNRTRIRPSAQAICRMEAAIWWPCRYLADSETARMVQLVALARSRELDIAYVARKLRTGAERVRDRNDRGLTQIASGPAGRSGAGALSSLPKSQPNWTRTSDAPITPDNGLRQTGRTGPFRANERTSH